MKKMLRYPVQKYRAIFILLIALFVISIGASSVSAIMIDKGENSSIQESRTDSPAWGKDGSLQVIKSAAWTNRQTGEAEITIKFNTKPSNLTMPVNADIIFIVDRSGTMKNNGTRWYDVNNAFETKSKEILNLNVNGYNNRVAYCMFNSKLYVPCPLCKGIHRDIRRATDEEFADTCKLGGFEYFYTDATTLENNFFNEDSGDFTNTAYDLPFRYVKHLLATRTGEYAKRNAYIIFLTDGGPYPSEIVRNYTVTKEGTNIVDKSSPHFGSPTDDNTGYWNNVSYESLANEIKSKYGATIYGIEIDFAHDRPAEMYKAKGINPMEQVVSKNKSGKPWNYSVKSQDLSEKKISEIYDEIIKKELTKPIDSKSSFKIIDKINSNVFSINGDAATAITTNIGKATLNGDTVTWTIDDLKFGDKAPNGQEPTLKIKIKIKDLEKYGWHKTNNGYATITYINPISGKEETQNIRTPYLKYGQTIKVTHYNTSTGKTLATNTAGTTYNGTVTVNSMPTGQYPNLRCTGYSYGGRSYAETSKTFTNLTSDQEITFYYTQSASVKTVTKIVNQGMNVTYSEKTDKLDIRSGGSRISRTSPIIPGCKLVGYTVESVNNSLTSSNNYSNMTKVTGNTATATTTINAEKDGNKLNRIITFIYEMKSDVSLQVLHYDNKNNINMAEYRNEMTNPMTYDLATLMLQVGLTSEENFNNYIKVINDTVNNKAARAKGILNIISAKWSSSNTQLNPIKSLDVQNWSGYPKYKLMSVQIGDKILIQNPELKNEMKEEKVSRYLPDMDGMLALIDASTVTSAGVIPLRYNYRQTYTVTEIHRITDGNGTTQTVKTHEVDPDTSPSYYAKDNNTDTGLVYRNAVINASKTTTDRKVTIYNIDQDTEIIFNYLVEKVPDDRKPKPPTADTDGEDLGEFVLNNDAAIIILDEKFTINFENSGKSSDGADWKNAIVDGYEKRVKVPFDVYYGSSKKFYPKDSTIEIPMEVEELEFILPVWVEENLNKDIYSFELEIVDTGNKNEIVASGDRKRVVIGKIYDFAITNLEGDLEWKTRILFKDTDTEYRADKIAIGQKMPETEKYSYGIKMGSTALFSVNTKGSLNSSININPRILYVDKNGKLVGDVSDKLYCYTTGKVITKLNADEVIKLSTRLDKSTRATAEVKKEILKAKDEKIKDFYNAIVLITNSSLGSYKKLNVPVGLRTPYINYLTSSGKYDLAFIYGSLDYVKNTKNISEEELLKDVSHWYAEYKLPSTTMIALDGKAANARKADGGYYIVLFEITSNYENNENKETEYLRYGGQWLNENGNIKEKSTILPSGQEIKKSIVDGKIYNYPVIVYQSDISINDDYEVSGTH